MFDELKSLKEILEPRANSVGISYENALKRTSKEERFKYAINELKKTVSNKGRVPSVLITEYLLDIDNFSVYCAVKFDIFEFTEIMKNQYYQVCKETIENFLENIKEYDCGNLFIFTNDEKFNIINFDQKQRKTFLNSAELANKFIELCKSLKINYEKLIIINNHEELLISLKEIKSLSENTNKHKKYELKRLDELIFNVEDCNKHNSCLNLNRYDLRSLYKLGPSFFKITPDFSEKYTWLFDASIRNGVKKTRLKFNLSEDKYNKGNYWNMELLGQARKTANNSKKISALLLKTTREVYALEYFVDNYEKYRCRLAIEHIDKNISFLQRFQKENTPNNKKIILENKDLFYALKNTADEILQKIQFLKEWNLIGN